MRRRKYPFHHKSAADVKKRCYFIGAPGGSAAVANHFATLATELANRGNEVKVISSSLDMTGQTRRRNPAVLAWPSSRPTRIADALFLAKLIHRHRPDCMIANFAAVNWMCVVGWFSRVRNRIAFYHTFRAQIHGDHQNSESVSPGVHWFRKKLVYKTATVVAGISQAALRDAQAAYGVPSAKCRLWRYSMPDPAKSHNTPRSPPPRPYWQARSTTPAGRR